MKLLHTISHLSIVDDYRSTSRTFVQFWQKILLIAFIPNALTFILSIAMKLALGNAFANSSSIFDAFSFTNVNFIPVLLLAIGVILVQSMGIVAMIYVVVHTEHTTILQAIEETLTYLGRFVIMSVLIFLFSLIGLSVGYLIVFILGSGVAFLSLPVFNAVFDWLTYIAQALSLLTALFFVFAPYLLIRDKMTVMAALKRSKALVRKSFVSVVVRMSIFAILSTVLALALIYIPRIGSLLSAMIITPFSVVFIFNLLNSLERTAEPVAKKTAENPIAPQNTTPVQSAS